MTKYMMNKIIWSYNSINLNSISQGAAFLSMKRYFNKEVALKIWNFLKKNLTDEEVRFRLFTTAKILIIPTIFLLIISSFIAVLLKLDLYYFEANGLIATISTQETFFYDYFFSELSDYLLYVGLFFIFLTFISLYVSDLFIRPFRTIGDYCEKRTKNEKASYDMDFFADLKLLTQFSDFFFSSIEQAFERKKMGDIQIPEKYTRIHKPVFEKAFFIQFSALIFMSVICTSIALFVLGVELHDSMVQLAFKTLKPTKEVAYFLKRQSDILSLYIGGGIILHTLLYFYLALNLYQSVATPAFGVFATMRSFLKGNYSSRVHLIGFSYLRGHCRKLNKYLDYIEKNLVHNQSGQLTSKDS